MSSDQTNEHGEYVPVPEQARIVHLIYELTLKNYTLRQVRDELKRRGIRTIRNRDTWSIAALGDILRNEIYLGIYRFHKSKHGRDVDGSRYRINRQDQIVVGSREKPNRPALIEPWMFDTAKQKLAANLRENGVRLYMATGLLKCPVCSAAMHAKYSSASRKHNVTVVKYACSKKPKCLSKRLLVSETKDTLWNSLVQLFVQPERIHSLLAPAPENDVETLKKELMTIEREQNVLKEKQDRLLNLYLEGNIPQASYVVKSAALEAETSGLSNRRSDLQQRIQSDGKRNVTAQLIQTHASWHDLIGDSRTNKKPLCFVRYQRGSANPVRC